MRWILDSVEADQIVSGRKLRKGLLAGKGFIFVGFTPRIDRLEKGSRITYPSFPPFVFESQNWAIRIDTHVDLETGIF